MLTKPVTRDALRRILAMVEAAEGAGETEDGRALVHADRLGALRDDLGPELAERLLVEFLESGDAVIAAIRTADLGSEEARREVHKLAGSALVFGADRLWEAMTEIETEIRAGRGGALGPALGGLGPLWQDTRTRISDGRAEGAPGPVGAGVAASGQAMPSPPVTP